MPYRCYLSGVCCFACDLNAWFFLGYLCGHFSGRCINARPLAVDGCVFVDGRLSGRGKVK